MWRGSNTLLGLPRVGDHCCGAGAAGCMSLEKLEDFVRQMVNQAPTRLFVQTLLVLDGAEKHTAEDRANRAKLTDKVATANGTRTPHASMSCACPVCTSSRTWPVCRNSLSWSILWR